MKVVETIDVDLHIMKIYHNNHIIMDELETMKDIIHITLSGRIDSKQILY